MLATNSSPLSDTSDVTRQRAPLTAVAGWVLIVGLVTIGLIAVRAALDKSHIALAYLLVVLIGASQLGRRAGIGLALLCFFAFNFFLLPPYHTLVVDDQRDWLVLLAFLLTSVIAAQLLYRVQNEAAIARARSLEVDRLSALGAESLTAGRAEDAISAIAQVVQSTLNLSSCEIFLSDSVHVQFRLVGLSTKPGYALPAESPTTNVFDYIAEHSAVAVERIDSSVHVLSIEHPTAIETPWIQRDAKVIVIPLIVRTRSVGLMRLSDETRIYLGPEQRRFAQALGYYAALGVERVRLMAEAERTEVLRATNQLKDSFVAAVSHDLRTPLTTIKGLAHEMRAADDRAAVIEQEVDRLNHFITDVLDLSKLNAGEVNVNLELNTAEDLVGAALAQVAGLPGGKEIKVTVPAGAVVVGRFDFVHSLRCLVNLIENALKYSPATTPVEVAVEENNAAMRVSVLDRGPGIESSHVPRIFEPFVRFYDAKTSGAGLGLAIADRLAAAQGGRIVYQQRDGGGSIFTLELPSARIDHQLTS